MGAKRMGVTWLTVARLSDTVYRPRHRLTRQSGNGAARCDSDTCHHGSPGQPGGLVSAMSWPDTCKVTDGTRGPDSLDHLTIVEIRRILEGYATDDVTGAMPELVPLIAHSSHTPATLTSAWSGFAQATRDAYALHLRIRDGSDFFGPDELGADPGADAVLIELTHADEAWRMITRGAPRVGALARARATAARSR